MDGPVGVDVLGALAAGDWSGATQLARAAATEHPSSRLAPALAEYLAGLPGPGVYDEPSAFEAFIDNGANPDLYLRTEAALREVHAAVGPATVLDIGCGDGRVTAAVLGEATREVVLVEPARALLDAAVARLRGRGVDVDPHRVEVATWLDGLPAGVGWDLVQATFALHTVAPDDRSRVLRGLAARAERVAVVEFDVPAFEDRSPAHLRSLAERYEAGLREYDAHPEVVRGFLLPVLVGQLDPARPRYTFEQPASGWVAGFEAAGFDVVTSPVSDYWWAPAVLISAEGAGER